MVPTSVVDKTHLPAHIPGILAKPPGERISIEQAALDAYNKKLGLGGTEKVGIVAETEAAAPAGTQLKIRKTVNKV